jgi:hypothetical protein
LIRGFIKGASCRITLIFQVLLRLCVLVSGPKYS